MEVIFALAKATWAVVEISIQNPYLLVFAIFGFIRGKLNKHR